MTEGSRSAPENRRTVFVVSMLRDNKRRMHGQGNAADCREAIAALSYVLAGGPQAAESKNEEYDQVQANLRRFDQLDFGAYSERKNIEVI